VADSDPRVVTVDEAYLRGAIETPMKEIVKDYPPMMPETPLKPAELDAIISYIKTLK
jgi:cytochrome c oxidase subunit 2